MDWRARNERTSSYKKQVWLHRLTEIDTDAMSGLCAHCGPVSIVSRGQGRFRCVIGRDAASLKSTNHRDGSHGLSRQEAKDLVEEAGQCALCPSTNDLVVDHCHKTGRIRGVLCRMCNLRLGHLEVAGRQWAEGALSYAQLDLIEA